jgi:DNA-directed RNA polymerase subunit RPC12/RpoP
VKSHNLVFGIPAACALIVIALAIALSSFWVVVLGVLFLSAVGYFWLKDYADKQEKERETMIQAMQLEKKVQQKQSDLEEANNWLKAGRYDDAAKIYEKWQMWDKAGEVRKAEKTTNAMSQSIVEGKSIRCNNCGAKMPLTSSDQKEITCPYCGERQTVP